MHRQRPPHVVLPLGQRSSRAALPVAIYNRRHPTLFLTHTTASFRNHTAFLSICLSLSSSLSKMAALKMKVLLVAAAVAVLSISGVVAQEAPAPSPTSDAAAFLPAALASVGAVAFGMLFWSWFMDWIYIILYRVCFDSLNYMVAAVVVIAAAAELWLVAPIFILFFWCFLWFFHHYYCMPLFLLWAISIFININSFFFFFFLFF